MPDKFNEDWRPVVEAPLTYTVSNLGRVKSLERMRSDGLYTIKERILKPILNKGYPRVTLRVDGESLCRFCHQMVMEAFIGPCPKGQESRHKDGNRANPVLDNLEYGTRAQNIGDAKRHGTFPIHEDRPGAKLTKAKAVEIARSAEFAAALADHYGIARGTVQQIRNAKTWVDVTEGFRKSSYHPQGSAHPNAKLTEDAVRNIRKSHMSQRALARHYGVDRVAIRNALFRITWKHVV